MFQFLDFLKKWPLWPLFLFSVLPFCQQAICAAKTLLPVPVLKTDFTVPVKA
ncbi:hypothetical protein ATPR_0400 [Acetobacter tropicalis NBRC 101654]|uniref:Uncharacterized protein n=1 Tax=Acetobacter tropicalis NBRC 101654 TaxID=749388 RepID=F7VAK1_9PROT|nr:hypothetical protein ATPR_0400 [Acetobacter tropicalis NBRC 101654]